MQRKPGIRKVIHVKYNRSYMKKVTLIQFFQPCFIIVTLTLIFHVTNQFCCMQQPSVIIIQSCQHWRQSNFFHTWEVTVLIVVLIVKVEFFVKNVIFSMADCMNTYERRISEVSYELYTKEDNENHISNFFLPNKLSRTLFIKHLQVF